MNNKPRNNNKSLFQKSMKMVTNILKLSSFSIAKMSLGSARPPTATKNLASMKGSIMVASEPLLPQFPPSQRSLEPERSSKPIMYLTEPTGEDRSSYVICEEKGVDGKIEDYIRKVREKNQYDAYEMSTLSPYILPPPPRIVK